ncbi:MAG: fasciclin domain-containing protein [Saprospiraceae bacterium]
MKNLKFFFLGLLCMNLFLMTSCGSDDEDDMDDALDIVATAQATDDLSSLVAALERANLVSTLQGDGPFTVLAPNNAAFQTLLDGNTAWSSIEDIPVATLETVLLYHVLGADVKAADLSNSYVTTAATGPNDEQISLQIDVDGTVVTFNGIANPLTTDIETTNGTVHIINNVMTPPTVVNHALNSPQFSILVDALTRSDHMTDFVDILSGDGPFTVFAPTNTAFAALLATNPDWGTLDDIPVETLDAVLKYHVINGTNAQSGNLSDAQVIPTFQGSDITIDLSDGVNITTGAGQSIPVELADVQGSNGVVHVIDEVLLFQ